MRWYLSTLQSYGLKPPRRMRICYMVLWLPDKSLKLNCIENVNTLTPRRKPSERPEKNLTFELLKILPKNFVLNKIGFIFAGVRTLYLFNLKPTPFLFLETANFPYTPGVRSAENRHPAANCPWNSESRSRNSKMSFRRGRNVCINHWTGRLAVPQKGLNPFHPRLFVYERLLIPCHEKFSFPETQEHNLITYFIPLQKHLHSLSPKN